MQQLVFNMHFPMWPFFEANVRPPIFYAAFSDHCHINRELIFKNSKYSTQPMLPWFQVIPIRPRHHPWFSFYPQGAASDWCVERKRYSFAVPLWLFSCKRARIWICFYFLLFKKNLLQKDDSKWVFKQTPWGTNTNSLSKPFPWYNNYPEYIGEATKKPELKITG